MLKITVLVENTARRRGFMAEHGLSLWLSSDEGQMLFDAGQSTAFRHNAARLGIDLRTADSLVLSHGHYDHGNGFRHFPAGPGSWPRFYAHPDVFVRRYARQSGQDALRDVGLDWQIADLPGLEKQVVLNSGTLAVTPSIRLCSRIPDLVPEAAPSAGFVIEKNGQRTTDRFLDEQVLIVQQKKGLVIICGCCHPGLLSTLKCVRELYPGVHIQAVLGGFHLSHASEQELDSLVEALQSYAFDWLVPMHCTGRLAWCRLREAFSGRCLELQTGDVIEF